jgi:hypothetical protein
MRLPSLKRPSIKKVPELSRKKKRDVKEQKAVVVHMRE